MLLLHDLSYVLIAWAFFAVLAAGLVHGTLGLGFPLVATPLLALAFDVRSAIIATLLPTVAVNIASIVRGGQWSQSIGQFWPLSVWAVAGSLIGTQVLIVSEPAPFKLLLAALVLLYLGTARFGSLKMHWTREHKSTSMFVFGLVAGLAAGTTNVMVPILIIYTLELGLAPTVMVQTFNLCFLAGKLAQIVVFGLSGLLTLNLVVTTLPLAVAALMALFVGIAIRDKIHAKTYRVMVKQVLLLLLCLFGDAVPIRFVSLSVYSSCRCASSKLIVKLF